MPAAARRAGTWALLRLARPHFLAGGLLLYALGAAVARYEGVALDGVLYAAGQAYVSAVQLMTQFLNEYWDVESDAANANRTWFSGGSGAAQAVAAGLLDRRIALRAALVCLGGALLAAIVLGPRLTAAAGLVMALALIGAWFYSSPPLRLAGSGFGELTASLVVALLVPVFAFLLQAGRISPLVVWTAAPLIALHFAMLLAFEIPDLAADEAAGKRTLLVRLGRTRGARAHQAALVAAYALLAGGVMRGVPASVAVAALLAAPLAVAQALTSGATVRYGRLTFGAVALFALTSGLLAITYGRLG